MPVLTNKITHRKSPKRRKESHAEDQEESSGSPAPERRNSSVCEDDDDDVDSVASSYSSASEHGSSEEEEEEEAGSKWAELGLSLKRNDLCRSPRRAPVSDRSLNVENTQVLRKNVAESIKESSRSENDFVYLNNLYTFTAVADLSKRNSHKHTPSKESEQRVKGLQRLRSIDEEAAYEELLMETKGFAIKKMIGDGNCLFRSVADQLYGDQEKHAQIREDCMDYMEKNREYFSQYVTEDFDAYLARKRMNGTYGNHVEIQAIAEVYNRRVEIYCYEATPLNIFQGEMALSDATPIRLSYHNDCHFNSVVDTRHPFVPLGTARPQSYRRQAYPSDSSSSGSSTLEEGIVKSVVAQSEQGDIESQVTEAAERESEQKALDDQMLMSVEKESEARCLEDEILRQVMKESAGDAYANTDAQDDMLQFALQQSRIASLTDVFKSIKIPPLANQQQQQQQQQQPPPPPK